jgi:hypothetical protein
MLAIAAVVALAAAVTLIRRIERAAERRTTIARRLRA